MVIQDQSPDQARDSARNSPGGTGRAGPPLRWRRFKYPGSLVRAAVLLGVLVFLGYSLAFLNVDLARLLHLFGRVGSLLAERYYPPEIGYVLAPDYLASVVETLQMA